MGKMFHNNIPISNRVKIIIELADYINNYQDCDVIQECNTELKKSIYCTELNENITALINACGYRVGMKNKTVRAMLKLYSELKKLI